ncbi:tannase/feruloyl esterase family alpha/beta hydrolase [Occallatibacter riparius]|uniref:Tannase/feruloyl esterase family alpha/beta hydrolase n=1 Tax=Occallatibacter riparius TaxID=1002689 RepID=A0A9J7BU96_9BACT|nr:tannase/feruloyl esterase family alpha/beta hydrolase [Occallatibacter riparius]UWZ84565.1 tannase/feruloyl esterase family alpha/beta hydrolase [Occallatibacter riparius]
MMKCGTWLALAAVCFVCVAKAEAADACAGLSDLKIDGVEITKTAAVPAGTTIPGPYPGSPAIGPLPAHCRVDGVINRRKGVGGEEFGIGFAVALPEKSAWNGDFMMQGGGGGNGTVGYPTGANNAGDKPALVRGFAVASTDTGHKAKTGGFDFNFMHDQQAYLDFAFMANAEVAGVAKQIIAHYYAKPAAYAYFVGCSTGGREGMILSQRYPTVFNGIVSGDPAMRTGRSNLAIAQWIPVAYNQASPKDAAGKPELDKFLTDGDRKVFMDALLKKCDAKDGVADGMIFDPMGCDFDPAEVACKAGASDGCIAPEKVAAIKKAFAGPKNAYGTEIYPGFLYDTGIVAKAPISGLLNMGTRGIFGPYTTATEIDMDKAALNSNDPLVEPASTNMSTFSGNGGKLIFFHGDSDPWFSPLDTLEYYKSLAEPNGGAEKVATWSRMFLVPGMGHCGGGPALDNFDMLSAVVNWVEKGTAPDAVVATGKAFPGRSRPLCAYPEHAQYAGSGDTQDARNFQCK